MKNLLASLAVLLGACTTTTIGAAPDTVLGSGTVTSNGAAVTVTSAWAITDYAFDDNFAYAGIGIVFTADAGTAAVTCRDLRTSSPNAIDTFGLLQLQTSQRHEMGTAGAAASLSAGDIPIVADDGVLPPPETVASLDSGAVFDMGHVTISAIDDLSMTGTFTAANADGTNTVSGAFDVPICNADIP